MLSSLGDFAAQHERYAQCYPMHASRVRPYASSWLAGAGLVYMNFLNNAHQYLPALQQHHIPFVLTLYPGGGFDLDEPESDAKLAAVLASPCCKPSSSPSPSRKTTCSVFPHGGASRYRHRTALMVWWSTPCTSATPRPRPCTQPSARARPRSTSASWPSATCPGC